jgi:carbon starvation protein CstA
MIALWAAAMYLFENKKNHWICTIPATFMSAVSMTYFIAAPECLGLLWTPMGLAYEVYYPIALVGGAMFAVLFLGIFLKATKKHEGIKR